MGRRVEARQAVDCDEPERSRAFMLDERQWGAWPFCPMKNRLEPGPDGFPYRIGLFFWSPTPRAADSLPMFAADVNLFSLKDLAERLRPASVDELLAAGWLVD